MSDKELFEQARQFWDSEANTFDNEADHGLRDPLVRAAWRTLISQWLPPLTSGTPKKILDIGCGTGSLSLLLAEMGHDVTGIDLSPAMIAQAHDKAASAGQKINFQVMNAAYPNFTANSFDAILCRHLLWTLPNPAHVLQRWETLLVLGGRLILIEGFWVTGAGLHTQETVDALPPSMSNLVVQNISGNATLWGGEVSDERYVVVADKTSLN